MTRLRSPDQYVPTDDELLAIVRARPMISLRELCVELWPAVPWRPETPSGDSLTGDLRVFPAGKGSVRRTASGWVLDQMQRLVVLGHVRFAPLRRDEPDKEAAVSYVLNERVAPPAESGRTRVLLVEDEPLLSAALCRFLGEHEIEVHPVSSAEMALTLIRTESAFDVIITDLRLPGMSGQELVRRLRRPRLIALSGDAGALSSLTHFDVLLRKPCRAEELVAAIKAPSSP